MTLKPFYAEQAVVVDGETYRLAINFQAMDATEHLLDQSYGDILDEIQKPGARIGLMGKVVWGLLREHHPELTIDQSASLLFGETGLRVGLAVSALLNAAFPVADQKAKGKNPPKPRGASKPS